MVVLAPALGCSVQTQDEVRGAVTTTYWNGCPRGVSVQLKVIAGANHAWPGGLPGVSGVPTDALDATSAIWDFFAFLEQV
jgi:poly(3-hydroxybutyrate) depolymerase